MQRLNRLFNLLLRAREGVAALEFALISPFLLMMFLGMFEVSRYILIHQKVEKTAFSISDIVAQAETMTTAQLNQIFTATQDLMAPYSFNTNGVVIVTSISKSPNNPPTVLWQSAGGGSLMASSQLGNAGQTATLPTGFTMDDYENVIIAEVFYNFVPVTVQGMLASNQIYKMATYRPRLGALTTLN